ncbi:MAG TPA: non-ribosomal peptide synthetase [Streptosporangiaceae bacterium]|nr:non-ribosomal peptide synthetase [Streptosporangiaceae bacterium]
MIKSRPAAHSHGPVIDYPRDTTVHEVFAAVASAAPEREALLTPDRTVTYGELDASATALARALAAAGVSPADIVAARCGRGIAWVTAYLATLKAGGAFLPVSEKEPPMRAALLVADSGATAVITDADESLGEIPHLRTADAGPAATALPSCLPGEQPAYVLYTSGSTGTPKGVLVTHRNVMRLVTDPGVADYSPAMRVLQTTAVSFDVTTFEIWGPLLAGGSIVLVADDTIVNPRRLAAAIERFRPTTLWLTSPLFSQIASQDSALFRPLRELLVGGDVVVSRHVAAVLEACPGLRVVNGYGPTENTTFSTVHVITADDVTGPIPIGKPLANSSAYVLGPDREPVADGQDGEIYLGGDGVAAGYLNRPELTRARFTADPFRPGGRMYRTGDLGRCRPDGVLEYLGRIDDQLKVRGYRVEPGEIEQTLRAHPDVIDAVVVPHERDDNLGGRFLTGYVASRGEVDEHELRDYLAARLPAQLIPGFLIVAPELPLNAHGKVDKSALPDPLAMPDLLAEYIAPRTIAEERIAGLWQRILGIESPGALDSLFDYGADSLGIARLAAAMTDEFGLDVTVSAVFSRPTVEELAVFTSGGTTGSPQS